MDLGVEEIEKMKEEFKMLLIENRYEGLKNIKPLTVGMER